MNKIIGGLVPLLLLAGCSSTTPTVTVTAEATQTVTQAPKPTAMSLDDEFDAYMMTSGTASYLLGDPTAMMGYRDLAKSACELLDSGFTGDEIVALSAESLLDANDDVIYAIGSVLVGATTVYCPEYSYVW